MVIWVKILFILPSLKTMLVKYKFILAKKSYDFTNFKNNAC